MKLCVNYLMELRELLAEHDLSYIDYIKLFSIDDDLSPFEWCVSQRNVMFHGFVGNFSNIADIDFFENRDIELQKEYYKRGNTPYISVHINKGKENEDDEENTIRRIVSNVNKLREIFNMRVLLENVPISKNRKSYDYIAKPEFITRVIEETKADFLFDIGHARAAAETLHIPFSEYVERLPMDRVVEMHLAGSVRKKDGMLSPNHSKMNEEDYKFLENALEKYKTLEVITLEYGTARHEKADDDWVFVDGESINPTAKQELYEQLTKIHEIIEKHKNNK